LIEQTLAVRMKNRTNRYYAGMELTLIGIRSEISLTGIRESSILKLT